MALSCEDFIKAVKFDKKLLERGIAPPGVDTCDKCSVPLQSFITGREFIKDESGNELQICSDCYYDMLGDEIDKHPIISPSLRR